MVFKSGYSWVFLILAVLSLWIGISGLLDNEPDIFGLRDSLAWVVILAGVFSAYQFISITFRTNNK